MLSLHRLLAALAAVASLLPLRGAETRIGLIGLDSSHCIQFAKLLQDPKNPEHVDGGRIVAAYKGGSADVEMSASRVDGFARELEKNYGVKICATIEEVAAESDALMILSLDGRTHLPQARHAFVKGKPVFVDKPAGGTLADGIALFDLARERGTPVFSASSLRYGPNMDRLKAVDFGTIQGAFSYGPAPLEPHHPDLFWYGVHAVEALYAVMGTGCRTVVSTHTANADIVTGTWDDGRTGTVRGMRDAHPDWGLIVFGTKTIATKDPGQAYASLLREIVKFFHTRVAPVGPAETIETLAFMEAADESKRRGGVPVAIAEVMEKAETTLH